MIAFVLPGGGSLGAVQAGMLEALLERHIVADAVRASTALPGVFPPHRVSGRLYLDGGLVDHVPLAPAIAMGADTIYVLSCGFPCPPHANHRSARSVLAHSRRWCVCLPT